MGQRGKPPVPTAILKLRGSHCITKKRQRLEMTGPAGAPLKPRWVTGAAGEAWDELVRELDAVGVLTKLDQRALGRYCRAFIRWLDAEDFIAEHGTTYPVKDGDGNVVSVRRWPQVITAERLYAILDRLEDRFGMTPSARSRIAGVTCDTRRASSARNADNLKYFGAG